MPKCVFAKKTGSKSKKWHDGSYTIKNNQFYLLDNNGIVVSCERLVAFENIDGGWESSKYEIQREEEEDSKDVCTEGRNAEEIIKLFEK